MTNQCSEYVCRGAWSFRSQQCSRKGSVLRDGKWYCKTHDPVERKRKGEEELQKHREKYDKRHRQHERVIAMEKYFKGVPTEKITGTYCVVKSEEK